MARRFVIGAITLITLMRAPRTGTTVLTGSQVGSSSAPAPGITGDGDVPGDGAADTVDTGTDMATAADGAAPIQATDSMGVMRAVVTSADTLERAPEVEAASMAVVDSTGVVVATGGVDTASRLN